jgi:ubiquinone/menaquinone biosynthesis C-methylase UbiE
VDWIGLLERAFYRLHRRRNVAKYLRGEFDDTAGARVLDFGGGTGRVSIALAATGPETFVVADPRLEALHRGSSLLRVRIMGTPALPFRDESFHAIFAVDVFHHVPDVVATLAECARCLQPAGRLHIVEFDERARLTKVFGWLVRRQGRSCHFWTPERLVSALGRLGLEAWAVRLDGLRFAVRAKRRQPAASL